MNENALNLYCPHCKRVSEVVTEAGQFVCVECGWQVSKDISSKLLNPQSGHASPQPALALAPREDGFAPEELRLERSEREFGFPAAVRHVTTDPQVAARAINRQLVSQIGVGQLLAVVPHLPHITHRATNRRLRRRSASRTHS